ncbi:MAG TPA: hypothetical protein VJO34_05425 [Methylomirabilota bacterium]|nr:hypothetical protein [Methylomirabilota bacterium]
MLVASGVGVLSNFLPWAYIPFLGAFTSTAEPGGWAILALFFLTGIGSLVGQRDQQLDGWIKAGVLVLAVLAGLLIVGFFARLHSTNQFGIGAGLAILSAVAIVVSTVILSDQARGPSAAAGRLVGVTLVATLAGLIGVLSLVSFIAVFAFTRGLTMTQVAFVIMRFGIGVVGLIAAYGLWVRKPWGTSVGVILYGAMVAFGALNLLIPDLMAPERPPTARNPIATAIPIGLSIAAIVYLLQSRNALRRLPPSEPQ